MLQTETPSCFVVHSRNGIFGMGDVGGVVVEKGTWRVRYTAEHLSHAPWSMDTINIILYNHGINNKQIEESWEDWM